MSFTWRVNDASADELPRREPGIAPGKVSLTSSLARGGRSRSADADLAAAHAPASPHQGASPERVDGEELADPFDFSPDAMGTSTKQTRPRGSSTPAQRGAQLASPTATPAQPASPSQPPLQRVRAAIAAADLPALVTLQRELRAHLVHPTPEHPAEPAREALTAARHWEMERVVAIRATFAGRLATARATILPLASTTEPNRDVEDLEREMDGACALYLDALLVGDPQHRYEHTAAIQEEVFAAVRLHVARRADAQVGQRPLAERESRAHGGVRTGEWCGAFAYTQAEQAGGFDRTFVVDMQGEGGIRHALAYGGAIAHTWIWSGDDWYLLRDYHQSRRSQRWYEEIHTAPPSRGIQPGDIVLIDNAFGTNPDHITTAVSFDGHVLTTVGGNQGSGQAGVGRNHWDLAANPEPNDVRRIVDGRRVRERDRSLGPKHVRIHGIGRWSAVDYEQHLYSAGPNRPAHPPSEAQLARLQRDSR